MNGYNVAWCVMQAFMCCMCISQRAVQLLWCDIGVFPCANSLFKVREAVGVDAQLDSFLGLCSTVLDDTHGGLITWKLQKNITHRACVSPSVCLSTHLCFLLVNISVSHPFWLIISELEEQSHCKGQLQNQSQFFYLHFLFSVLYLRQLLQLFKWRIINYLIHKCQRLV